MRLSRRLAIETTRVGLRASAAARRWLRLDRTVYVGERVAEYRSYWEEGARLIGASFEPVSESVWDVSRNGARTRIANHITKIDAKPVRWKAGDKPLCYDAARACGIPVPPHLVLDLALLDQGRAFLTEHPGPFVVKPAYGTSSALGVTTGIRTWREYFRAAVLASSYDRRFLLERMIAGESWRVLVLDSRVIHAVRRRGVRVTGDGQSTIRELLVQRNPAGTDWIVQWTLAAQGLSLESVPPAGVEVLVRSLPSGEGRTRELRTVYTESVTSQVGPEVADRCVALARSLGSSFAGIDLIANDLGRPLEETGGMFLEINTTPGIHHHYHGPEDHRNPVAATVLTHLLEGARASSGDTP